MQSSSIQSINTHFPRKWQGQSTNILGVQVSAVNMPMAVSVVNSWIRNQLKHYICVTPAHSVMDCLYDDELRKIFNTAGLVTPDGMPIVWLSRLYGYNRVDRVYGPDLMLALCANSIERGYRHYFYGGHADVLDNLIDNLKRKFPELQIAGSYSPPFRTLSDEEDEEIVEMINSTKPHIVWVGLGSPKQEYWMAEHQNRLTANALIGVGAAFDFHAGAKAQAPYWIQRSGFEWLFRLANEPKRLWKRYLLGYPLFIYHVLLQLSKLREYPNS
ncbi:MAG: WecB/TagA/CpsF family glycosyltransferase [Chloroflexota bacterium]